jgi:hypothetical protein
MLASRVMKARRPGVCPVCRTTITVGQLIARCGYWMHAACLIEHNHKSSTEEKP